MPETFRILLSVMVSMSIIGSLMVLIDKYNAIHSLYRISENTLLIFGLLGGAFIMFLTMKLCRHKIRKPKFMLTFPLMTVLQVVVLFLCYK